MKYQTLGLDNVFNPQISKFLGQEVDFLNGLPVGWLTFCLGQVTEVRRAASWVPNKTFQNAASIDRKIIPERGEIA